LDFDICNVELIAKTSMPEIFKNITTWLATSGIKVLGILKELAVEEPWKRAILEPLHIFGVEGFGESQLVIRVVVKTIPLKQWEVGRKLRRRIKNRFDEKGIQIPFPHRVLIWGDKNKSESNAKCQNPNIK